MTDVRRLERLISRQFDSRHVVLTGHGSTAIYLALKAVEAEAGRGEVLVSSIGCASIAQIIDYAGFTPRFVDINLDDYTLDCDALERAVTPAARAILPVHLFGHAAGMDRVMRIARLHGLRVIEDAAQSIGGQYGGAKLGTIGDFGILSFGGSKIVSAGGGGALLFGDDRHRPVIERELAALPPFEASPRIALKALSHRNLYHGVVDLLRVENGAKLEGVFRTAGETYRELYFHRFPESGGVGERIEAALAALPRELDARLRRAETYHQALATLPVRQSDNWRRSGSVWRYTFMLPTAEETLCVTASLRRNAIHASNHYWSLADLFCSDKSLPNTGVFCPRVLNLWVDDVADAEYIRKSCDVIAGAL
jgi:dTDP-4-amino-4,6-dideoxygalactose transaminase